MTINIENNANFDTLCQLTLSVCGRSEFPAGTFSDKKNMWVELAEAWETLLEDGSAGIFLDAVHRIMWGMPFGNSRPKHEDIVSIVKEELLSDGEAFKAWDTYIACDTAIIAVGNDMDPWVETDEDYRYSLEHYHYLWDKMLWKIRYSKPKYIAEYAHYGEAILDYEEAIKKIVPAATSWNEDYWCNENHIYDEIVSLYGVDYRDDYVEYGRILLILMNKQEDVILHDLNEVWYAANIKRMPMSLAETIWPENTDEKIMQMFVFAVEATKAMAASVKHFVSRKEHEIHPVGVFEYDTLRESWLCALMEDWMERSDLNDEDIAVLKLALFEVEIGG